MLLYNIKTHPFFLKRDFSKRLLNDEFQKFVTTQHPYGHE